MSLRIAMVVHKVPPESLGGTEIYTASLARALAAQGDAVTIFTPSTAVATAERSVDPNGVTTLRLPLSPRRAGENPAAQFWHTVRDLGFEREFGRFLAEEQPQIVHFQHVQGVSARLVRMAQGRPRVVTLHDYWYFCANSQLIRPADGDDPGPCAGPSPGCRNCVDCATARADLTALRALRPLVALPLAWRNAYLRSVVDEVDLFVAPSDFLRRMYVAQGFPADRILQIENGMDRSRLQHPGRVHAAAGPVRFGYLGTYAPMKGAHVLVDAFNRLPAGAATLTLHGSDRAFPEYAAGLRSAARHPGITVSGAIDPAEVGRFLCEIDALVVPSIWYENSPLVIQEAYALGVPVIASRLGALEEKVREGVSGRLFPAGDSLALADVMRSIVEQPDQLDAWRSRLTPPPSSADSAAELRLHYRRLIEARR